MAEKLPVSVIILTLNEEINIQDCIRSAQDFDEILVFDSFSTDRTVELAISEGARVLQRKFDNYATQRNEAISSDLANEWIYMMDADERFTPEFIQEIRDFLGSDISKKVTLARSRRKDFLKRRWLKRSTGYPTWSSRMFRKERVKFVRDINEICETDGDIHYFQEHFEHYPFKKGLHWWFERHNRYSTMEAKRLKAEMEEYNFKFRNLFSKDPTIRRACAKQLAYRLPFHFVFVFLYFYVVKRGFLDGRAGFQYSLMRMTYELMIYIKIQVDDET